MNAPLVSIIIPIYNVSNYLDACVESACRQSYANLEIILVDDGSPDDCPQKCDVWAAKDSRIKVIHKPNGGLSDARNAGLDIATGKYIYFLDGDDTVEPNLIETVVPHMENGADMVVFHFLKRFDDGAKKRGQIHETGEFALSDEIQRRDFIIGKLLAEKIGWEAWSRIYRKSKIDEYNLRFADNKKIFAEDLFFCLCYCAHAEKIVSIPEYLYNYAVRSDSIMNTQQAKLNVGRMNDLCKEALFFFEKWKDCMQLVRNFPAIHFLIINNVWGRACNAIGSSDPNVIKKAVIEDIADFDFFKKQAENYFKYFDLLKNVLPAFQIAEKLSFFNFIIGGTRIGLSLRSRVIYAYYRIFSYYFGDEKKRKKTLRNAFSKTDTVVIVGTEDFGNIGDHQIAVSMIDFIKIALPDYNIVEITASNYHKEKSFLKYLKPQHIVVMPGGGNFGDIYPFAQNIREEVIDNYPENKKLIFPQTIHFSDNTAIEKATSLFTKENEVYLFARDKVSFDFAKSHFSCKCQLVPDIVLSHNGYENTAKSNDVLLCLRSDKEARTSSEKLALIEKIVSENNLRAIKIDTQLSYDVPVSSRDKITKETLALWANSKLVITDRLHGMVFAAITGTPCIALSNYNHKISGSYEFIKYLPYIKFVKTEEEIITAFSELISMADCKYDNTPLLPYYEKLAEELQKR